MHAYGSVLRFISLDGHYSIHTYEKTKKQITIITVWFRDLYINLQTIKPQTDLTSYVGMSSHKSIYKKFFFQEEKWIRYITAIAVKVKRKW